MKFTFAETEKSNASAHKFQPASAYIIPEPLLGYWRPTLAAILLMLVLLLAATAHAQQGSYLCTALLHEHGRQCIVQGEDSLLDADSPKMTSRYGWVTDSTKWVTTDTVFDGKKECAHDWVHDAMRKEFFGYHKGEKMLLGEGYIRLRCDQVSPDGKHCNEHQSATREKICRNCLHSEIEREQWFQHYIPPPKTEFERLKEKQRKKR